MSWVATGVIAGATLINGLNQASAVKSQARLNRNIAEFNADLVDHDAWEAEKFGYTQSARYQSTIDSTAADQQVAFASQGVDTTFGTAARLQEETHLTGFLNNLDLHRIARSNAKGLRSQASSMRLQGIMGTYQANIDASAIKTQAALSAANTGLAGYSKGKG